MGEMTIRLDEALIFELTGRAEALGVDAEMLAADLLRQGLDGEGSNHMTVARSILARSCLSPISSVELLDQIRDEGRICC